MKPDDARRSSSAKTRPCITARKTPMRSIDSVPSMRILATLVLALVLPTSACAEIIFQPGATILFYGNSMVERLGEHGELEALVQLAHPEEKLHFRSFAWT